MTQVKTTMALAVAGGPAWTINRTEDVEAYDVVTVEIAPGAADTKVQLQPGASSSLVVLAIQSTLYGPELTYKASDDATDSAPLTLHGPQVFGRGVAALFGRDVKVLKFSNAFPQGTANKTAVVQVFVGRDATP